LLNWSFINLIVLLGLKPIEQDSCYYGFRFLVAQSIAIICGQAPVRTLFIGEIDLSKQM
jgi:hypothetical protein